VIELANILGIKITSVPWDGADKLPFALNELYVFRKAMLGDVLCIFAEPKGDVPTIQALVRHFERVRAVEDVPVALKLNTLSEERRKALIGVQIPFVAAGQVFLPFMGTVLSKRLYGELKQREKLTPSAQLLLFAYLYQPKTHMHTNGMAERLGISAMQVTRAVRQLQRLGLFDVSKDGVRLVVTGKSNHRALFESAALYLIDPVCDVLYVPNDRRPETLPIAGMSALAQWSMLSPPSVVTYACHCKADRPQGGNALIDRDGQSRLEIWRYTPTILSMRPDTADALSVIMTLRDERDPRVEQAIEETLSRLWETDNG
jgi:hypothetical protein